MMYYFENFGGDWTLIEKINEWALGMIPVILPLAALCIGGLMVIKIIRLVMAR